MMGERRKEDVRENGIIDIVIFMQRVE